jgi:hypothetical protein
MNPCLPERRTVSKTYFGVKIRRSSCRLRDTSRKVMVLSRPSKPWKGVGRSECLGHINYIIFLCYISTRSCALSGRVSADGWFPG